MTLSRSVRRIFALGGVVMAGLLVGVAVYVVRERSFDVYRGIPARQLPADWNVRVKVGIIGDSWVAGGKLDEPLRRRLSEGGLEAEVVSSGHPGAKSREIYRDLLADPSRPNSGKALLMDEDLDYLVVIAGVNDTFGHIGRDFYAYHILGIIQAAQDRAVEPLVVEVPEYGIECTPASGVASWGKHLLYRYLFDGGKVNVIEDYRRELSTRLTALPTPVTVIRFGSFVRDHDSSSHVYADPSHLNPQGNAALASLIAGEVIELHRKRTTK